MFAKGHWGSMGTRLNPDKGCGCKVGHLLWTSFMDDLFTLDLSYIDACSEIMLFSIQDQPAQKKYIIINVSHIVCCLSKCEINSSIITLFLPSHFYNCNQGFKQSITVIKPKMHKNTVALDRNTPNLNLPPKYFSSSAPDCT